jgi:hypothetical protein
MTTLCYPANLVEWGNRIFTFPEAFLFVWMAIERLVGEKKGPSICPKCKKPLKCEVHGENSFSSVSRDRIREFLERHQVQNVKRLLDLRNPLVHGSLAHSFEHRAIMHTELPKLSKVAEEELRLQLGVTHALNVSPFSGPGDNLILVHCEYRTSFPDQKFPIDCPSFAEVDQYLKRPDQSNHPKIINLLSWPPGW